MRTRLLLAALSCVLLSIGPASFAAKSGSPASGGNVGEKARDFPPGMFTDNAHYGLEDFQGKVLVLYFGCPICPTNRASIPGRNKVVEQFKDKPVKFLAITPRPINETREYTTGTRLEMPCFADGLGVMQHRYGTAISLQNIYQVRVINPQGKIVGYDMTADAIEKAVENVKWKYKDDGYDPRLNNIVMALEWNQYVPAMTALKQFMKMKTKLGDSARALYEKVKSTEGAKWAAEAEAAGEDKIKAAEIYSQLAACFPDDELGKNANDQLKKLKTDKSVADEMAARQMYSQLYSVMSKAQPSQKMAVVKYCVSISQKYPETATGKVAGELAQEVQESNVGE